MRTYVLAAATHLGLFALPATALAVPLGVDVNRGGGKAFRITGEYGDASGYTVAAAGDVNDDGIQDVVVGAPYADFNRRTDSGSVYVVYGRRPWEGVDLHLLDVKGGGFRVDGVARGDRFGTSVAGGQDLDGDGYDDIVVGAPKATFYRRSNSGAAYVIYGGPRNGALDLKVAPPDVYDTIGGRSAGDNAGSAVALSRDTNGDTVPDVLVGAPGVDNQVPGYTDRDTNTGAAFVLRWARQRLSGVPFDMANAAPGREIVLEGSKAQERAGTSVADAGPLNGDATPEVIVGAPQASPVERKQAGSAYVFYGDPGLFGSVSLSVLANSPERGFRIDGPTEGARFGTSVAGVGDIDANGSYDVLVGAPGAPVGRRYSAGRAYLIYGQSTRSILDTRSLGPAGFAILGAAFDDKAGSSVSSAGDVNRDGFPDLLIGAYDADNNCRGGSGSAYIVYGKTGRGTIALSKLEPTRGYRIDGAHAGDRLGFAVAYAPGFAADGPGVLVGGYGANIPRGYGGAAWALGHATRLAPTRRYSTRLPLTIEFKPGGRARDYGGYLSFTAHTTDGTIRDLYAGVYTFGGRRVGHVSYGRFTGRHGIDMKLSERLRPGGYSIVVTGQPNPGRYCGPKTKSTVVRFR